MVARHSGLHGIRGVGGEGGWSVFGGFTVLRYFSPCQVTVKWVVICAVILKRF